jgi:K+-transporting ATPase KdpF subunit
MSWLEWVSLAVSAAVAGFLVYALVRGERM